MKRMYLSPLAPSRHSPGRYYAWRGLGWLDRARIWCARLLLHSVETVVLEDSYLEIRTGSSSMTVGWMDAIGRDDAIA